MNNSSIEKINIDKVLRQKLPRYYKFIPRFLIKWMERIICQDRLNELLDSNKSKTNADFCRGMLKDLNITVNVKGAENLPPRENRRVVIVSNHPLGGLDGIALIDFLERYYGGKIHFIVNDILMVIKPLNGVFLPINKHGKQSRQSFRAIEEAFAGNDPIMIFPAGLVSRKGKGGEIADLKWQKMFVNKSIEYHRNVIPMYFDGKNSPFFYNFAKLRSRLGLKFNIEMIYLPREMVRSENAKYTISIGSPILWESLCPTSDCDAQHRAEEVRAIVYGLKEESHRK